MPSKAPGLAFLRSAGARQNRRRLNDAKSAYTLPVVKAHHCPPPLGHRLHPFVHGIWQLRISHPHWRQRVLPGGIVDVIFPLVAGSRSRKRRPARDRSSAGRHFSSASRPGMWSAKRVAAGSWSASASRPKRAARFCPAGVRTERPHGSGRRHHPWSEGIVRAFVRIQRKRDWLVVRRADYRHGRREPDAVRSSSTFRLAGNNVEYVENPTSLPDTLILVTSTPFGQPSTLSSTDHLSDVGLAAAFGGGFDIRLAHRLQLRTSMDWNPTFLSRPTHTTNTAFARVPSEHGMQSHARLSLGVVWQLGR